MRFPALARLLVRVITALPHGRVRRGAVRHAACRLNDAFNRRDLDTIPTVFHPSGRAHPADPQGTPLGFDLDPVYHGPAGFRKGLETWFDGWAEFQAKLVGVIDLGDRILLLHEYTGTGARSGMRVKQRNAQIYTLRRGWITEMRDYWDWDEALEAVGLSE